MAGSSRVEILAAEAYDTPEGRISDLPSAGHLGLCRPVWRRFSGWRTPTSGVRSWRDLPGPARSYLEWIESEVGVRIDRVSVGAGRDAEIPRP